MLSFNDLILGLNQIGVVHGDTIMVHSSYKSLGGVEGGAETVIDALLELVGSEGTVLFPTFNFQSWTENHYFDINETFSKMGMITELARTREGSLRTPHPIYSFAVLGKRQGEFASCNDTEAFGDESVFALFHKLNGTIISIGLEFKDSFTLNIYAINKTGCDFRRIKNFSGIYVGYDGIPQIKTYSMFVRSTLRVQTRITPGIQELIDRGVIKEIQIGKAVVHYTQAQEFFINWSDIVKQHPEKVHYVKPVKF